MLCPFCKHEVKVGTNVCNCGAELVAKNRQWVNILRYIVIGPGFIICLVWLAFAIDYGRQEAHGFERAYGWIPIAGFIGVAVLWRIPPYSRVKTLWVRR